MPNYRRARVPGGTNFFTAALARRGGRLLVDHIGHLRAAVRLTRRERPFRIDAMVILPDHLHAVWTLPPGDDDFPTRWMLIKTRFTRAIPPGEPVRPSRAAKRERGIWQRRYWEHLIRDEADYRAHVDYCHFNPVKHGLAAHPGDWPYSSFHRDLCAGLYLPAWAAEPPGTARDGEQGGPVGSGHWPPGPECRWAHPSPPFPGHAVNLHQASERWARGAHPTG
jgi:putative transposase